MVTHGYRCRHVAEWPHRSRLSNAAPQPTLASAVMPVHSYMARPFVSRAHAILKEFVYAAVT
eukprot:6207797-Pleurochrysis_carterae.AAC.2